MSLQLLKAGTSDVLTLNGISKRAFDSDILVGAASPSGPPGYMSMAFHMKMARQGHLYKLTDDGSIVGGAILFLENNVLNVGRIFVAPEHFRKGYGSFMMREVESLFPEVKEFTLDTPVWNVRTNDLRALFFILASMRQRLSFMRRMGLSCQRELYVCIVNNFRYDRTVPCGL